VSQTHTVALNCLSSQRCIALFFCAEEVIKKALSLTGEIFFQRRRENAIVGLAEFFSADFRPRDKIQRRLPNSAAEGSTLHWLSDTNSSEYNNNTQQPSQTTGLPG